LARLTDRELLLMVYSKVDTIAKSQTDIESRVRVLEAQSNRTSADGATEEDRGPSPRRGRSGHEAPGRVRMKPPRAF